MFHRVESKYLVNGCVLDLAVAVNMCWLHDVCVATTPRKFLMACVSLLLAVRASRPPLGYPVPLCVVIDDRLDVWEEDSRKAVLQVWLCGVGATNTVLLTSWAVGFLEGKRHANVTMPSQCL
jgi:hypothetical protein